MPWSMLLLTRDPTITLGVGVKRCGQILSFRICPQQTIKGVGCEHHICFCSDFLFLGPTWFAGYSLQGSPLHYFLGAKQGPILPTDVLVFLHPLVELPLRVWELSLCWPCWHSSSMGQNPPPCQTPQLLCACCPRSPSGPQSSALKTIAAIETKVT